MIGAHPAETLMLASLVEDAKVVMGAKSGAQTIDSESPFKKKGPLLRAF